MALDVEIEAVLFYKAAPMKTRTLAKFLEVSEEDIQTAYKVLSARLEGGATSLLTTDTEASLVTNSTQSDLIESLRKDDLKKDIGKAGAETLAIILYRGPISRAKIDRVRGVNSNFILRNLLIRGLIERRDHPTDSRSFQYAITPQLLSHMGITKKENLPEFESIMNALDTYDNEQKESEADEQKSVFES